VAIGRCYYEHGPPEWCEQQSARVSRGVFMEELLAEAVAAQSGRKGSDFQEPSHRFNWRLII
jgi:hypothetical protein